MNIYDALRARGFDIAPEDHQKNIETWRSWYVGDVKDFHTYKAFNGIKSIQCRRYTLGMAKTVAEDWANLLMNEKVKITLEDEAAQTFVDEVFTRNNFDVKMNELQEMKAALGAAAVVCRVNDASVDPETGAAMGGRIVLDYVTAEHIIPLSWENGIVTECAFCTDKAVGKDKYKYVQIHRIASDGLYEIDNALYADRNDSLSEVALSSVRGFENVPSVIHTGSASRLFVIDRPNIINNADMDYPLGISVYANAIDQLKGVDVAYDSYVNEFVLGKKRIMVKPEALKDFDGKPLFDPDDTAYYWLPEDGEDGNTIKEIDMSLRTDAHNTGIQDMLNALSKKCGFGENHYRFDRGSVSTATQIISENSTMFRTVKKHEIVLEGVLVELCRIILRLGNDYQGAGLPEDVEISIDFDDSIIEDKAADFQRDMQMMSAGVLNSYEFRMKWMNEDEETARAALPGMEALVSDAE